MWQRATATGVVARVWCAVLVALASSAVFAEGGLAASPGPAWEVSSVAHPTNFSVEDNAKCARSSERLCDQYLVTVTNVGGGAALLVAPVTIVDTLPAGLRLVSASGRNVETNNGIGCSGATAMGVTTVTCHGGEVEPGATLVVFVEVEVEAGAQAGAVTNAVSVSGGGAPPVSTSASLTLANTIDRPAAAFGLSAFGFAARDASGAVDMQAGDRPDAVTSAVNLTTAIQTRPFSSSSLYAFGSVEPPKDFAVYAPLGFLGDPLAAARCTELQLLAHEETFDTECPAASRVGQVLTFVGANVSSSTHPGSTFAGTGVYNVAPESGYAAEFGFKSFGKVVPLYANVVHTPAGYAVRVAAAGVPHAVNIEGSQLSLFGDPRVADGEPASSARAFFTNPDDCSAGPLTARVQTDSWVHPGQWVSGEAVAYPEITGCDRLSFQPTVELHPEVTQAEAPSGYEVKVKVPQTPEQFSLLATPQLKDVTMTLPEGMTLSPGGGDGLVGCEATGPHGIDMPNGGGTPTEVGEGEEIGEDGMSHLVPGHCPRASQIGTVRIVTPVLEQPVEGRVYVAQPRCGGPGQPVCTSVDAWNGNLFGLYLEVDERRSGVVVKLAASASVDPVTGRLTARFVNNPQFPVSEVTVQLKGGPRAPLANPRRCGAASMSGDLVPWSSPVTPDAIVQSPPFTVDWDGNGAPCPALPFAPTLLTAGTTQLSAGGFSPFTLTLSRGDRQQDVARLQVKLPPGLLGMLSKVSLCGEPQAALGTCGEGSYVGSVHVAAGSGPQPLWVQGRAYLTGPYAGAPFGVTVVVPAVAGPFNLGNVVVRARVDVDPHTSAVTITSDPFPQVLDGVPLRIQTLNVSVDRKGFIFNPTNCAAKQIATVVESTQGAAATPVASFRAEDCSRLPFRPGFSVSTQGRTSKHKGASLDVRVTSGPGQANIAGAVVSLPRQLPARLTTLQQACPEATFAANPATCPVGSNIGSATAVTPVLNEPVSGPAYLVSHGGAAFPDLVIILQAQGVRLDLVGGTSIKKSITTSTFSSVPDAPISSFELKLPEGPHSALTTNLPGKAKGNLCGSKLVMPTLLTGQNGAQLKQSTRIAVTGCPKMARARRAKSRHT
jgi:uncharacterized repeat protein (TIGR01451 family)